MNATIIFFKTNSPGINYGIGSYLKELIGALQNYQQIRILLISYYDTEYKEYSVVPINAQFTQIFIPSPLFYVKTNKNDAKYALRIIDLISGIIDGSSTPVFHINHCNEYEIARAIKLKYSHPLVVGIHSTLWQKVFTGSRLKFLEYLKITPLDSVNNLASKEVELYKLSDHIISVTNYMKKFITNNYGINSDKISVIRNGITYQQGNFEHKNEKINKIKQNFNLPADEKIILYVGRLDHSKGVSFLINSFKIVLDRYKHVRLIIVGDGEIESNLALCMGMWTNVTFTGFLEKKDINLLYSISDVGVIPSIYDHYPYVALEMILNKSKQPMKSIF